MASSGSFKESNVFKSKQARSTTEPPFVWEGTNLTISVQAAELRAVPLTQEDKEHCHRLANSRRIGIEYIINEFKLNRAGKIKFEQLKAKGLLKGPKARPSLSSADTQLVTPAPTLAPTTSSTVRSFLTGVAGIALAGFKDSTQQPVVTPEEVVEVSTYDSLSESLAGADTEDSGEEDRSDKSEGSIHSEVEKVPENNPTVNSESEYNRDLLEFAQREVILGFLDAKKDNLAAFEAFRKYRWKRYSIPVIEGAPNPDNIQVITYTTSLKSALLEEVDYEKLYRKDFDAIQSIAAQRQPWAQLGKGSERELFKELLHGQFTTNTEGNPSKVHVLYSEYFEVIKSFPIGVDVHELRLLTLRTALIAKLQLAYRFSLLTDEEEIFIAEDPIRFIDRICSYFAREKSPSSSLVSSEILETMTATIPVDVQQAINLAKGDIDQAESLIANNATAPLDIDDLEQIRLGIIDVEKDLRDAFISIYRTAGIPDDVVKDNMELQKTYHFKCKQIKLSVAKLTRALDVGSGPQQHRQGQGNGQGRSNSIPLPKMQLQILNGHWKSWLGFKSVMETTILNRPEEEASQVHKFYLLRQSLVGEPLRLIEALAMTAENLDRAWKMLNDRYHNPKQLLEAYINDITTMDLMKHPSAALLRETYERINNDREYIKGLKIPVETWDPIIVTKLAASFDQETKSFYELLVSMGSMTMIPTWESMGEFITRRCNSLDNVAPPPRLDRREPQAPVRKAMTAQRNSPQHNRSAPPCFMCTEYHWLRQCEKFKRLTVEGRSKFVRERQLCVNCFSPKHHGSSCPSEGCCRECNGRHNTMLHFRKGGAPQGWPPSTQPARGNYQPARGNYQPERGNYQPARGNYQPARGNYSPSGPQNAVVPASNAVVPKNAGVHNRSHRNNVQANASHSFNEVILPTARLLVKNAAQEMVPLRALLETGSQSTFISERAVQFLRLKRKNTNVQLSGIGQSATVSSKGFVILVIQSEMDANEDYTTTALILPQVTSDTPSSRLAAGSWTHLRGLQLADPQFNVPGRIDIVLGADIVFQCFTGARILGKQNQPVAHSTTFGWVVGGHSQKFSEGTRVHANLVTSVNLSIGTLKQFWGLEGISDEVKEYQNSEDRRCEEIFLSTTRRCQDGKLEVSFPFKSDPPDVGFSKEIAVKRLAGTEARLARNPELRRQYEEFMSDYEAQGHMAEVKTDGDLDVYLPHHPIIRTTALTTKLRVVFDASAKTSNGKSLNESQLVGPVIQDDLFSLLTRFRLHKVAITGDITAMYRQIWISPRHQDYQRILWRQKPADPISMFQLKTVTYGTASAPWLATRALKFIAENEQHQHPEAAKIIAEDFYMDDLMSGHDSAQEAHSIQEEVHNILLSYGFPLRKYASNDDYVIRAIKGEQDLLVNPDEVVKTLGLKWNRKIDAFQFNVQLKDIKVMTKREMISEIATTFDPLGFAAPVMVLAKILYQQVWSTPTDWDDELPPPIGKQYQALRGQLAGLESMAIPRWLGTLRSDTIELHCFTDASEKAYGAAVYLRHIGTDGIASNLVASKTRVAPLKPVSLPRLELMGAVLGAQLMEQVVKAFRRQVQTKFYWSDSTITLAWIKGEPGRFKTFIANRVATIQELSKSENWAHVGTKDNPADLCSRGIFPDAMKGEVLDMWLHGPPWLQSGDLPGSTPIPEAEEELKKVKVLHAVPTRNPSLELISKFSSFSKICRITALLGRLNRKGTWDLRTIVSPEEMKRAFMRLISVVQGHEYLREITALAKARDSSEGSEEAIRVLKKSQVANLNPMLDEMGVLRVGGRLGNSDMEYTAKHPAILPYGDFAKVYMRHLHVKNLHAGPTLLLATARQEVWPIRGPQLAREVVRKCVDCTRWRGETLQQQMGNLPASRTSGQRAFHITGVDYAGPVSLKTRKGRGGTTIKTWIAVFVCFSTKAVHLDLVSELSSEAFIAALRRFIARRGIPKEINSDNGTNFVGADKELGILLSQEKTQHRLTEAGYKEGIEWKFIPPSAPHQGGLWESAVKSVTCR